MQAYLTDCILTALDAMGGAPEGFTPEFEQPANPEHGDLSCNAAMQLARHFRKAPRQIADELAGHLRSQPLDASRIAAVEVAGPGFLNFRFADAHLADSLATILAAGDGWGRTTSGAGQRAMVEFVSANPTGPLTVGHGRNAVLGDTIATLLDWAGYDVTREYYFNDAGRQMRVLGESVRARYLSLVDPDLPTKTIGEGEDELIVPESFPEEGYRGDYILDIARQLLDEKGPDLDGAPDPDVFKRAAETAIFADIEQTLKRLNIRMDSFFNERSLYESNRIWDILDQLRAKDLVYDKDGAVWFRTTAFGKEADTVLVKSTGEPTYRLPDIGYHADKLDRGFDLCVDVFGADHIATFPDVLDGIRSLGYDADKVDVVIYQFVTLIRGGQPVKMSTRKATYVTLDELMDEVGEDVTRYFFLMRSPNTHLEFDLDLAKEASEKNPVFYLQYAHARICSILRKAQETGLSVPAVVDLSLLAHPSEQALIKVMMDLPGSIAGAAQFREPHRLANYLRDVAVAFTQFYGNCRIIGEAPTLAAARLALASAARLVLRNGLSVLGLSAPERM
ncbi:MAG: arginine--tRNA ligase [Bacteroidetes bacterium]|nr:arginine--tRNA ligase [Bacteroidota bacterium]MDA0874036.1 arginine--tRNA ligase [Bacteroidota bacterium]